MRYDSVLDETARRIYEAAGYGSEVGFGNRPALLVVDVTYGFTGKVAAPVLESILDYPSSCGESAWDAIPHIERLIGTAHTAGVPVFYTRGTADRNRRGRWQDKHRPATQLPPDAFEIIHQLRPRVEDDVIDKAKPSGFFATDLHQRLTEQSIDTVVVTGGTTSGCVRATVVDAFSHDYRTIVVEEAVFDRTPLSHAVSLFEMNVKYADVMTVDEVDHNLRAAGRPAGSP